MDTITITKSHLKAALLRWDQDYRAGKTMSHEEADAQPPDEAAERRATRLWDDLKATAQA